MAGLAGPGRFDAADGLGSLPRHPDLGGAEHKADISLWFQDPDEGAGLRVESGRGKGRKHLAGDQPVPGGAGMVAVVGEEGAVVPGSTHALERFQAYNLAYDVARSAERAYQFEQGITEGANGYIQPSYWESRRRGLLAGENLGLDLQRLGKAYLDAGRRGLEITKRVLLLALDPLALLALKTDARCEFALTEALFDRDFPGHFRRQIRTLSVTFETDAGPLGLNATLTQLDNRTVLSADPKAVKCLLDPKGSPPASLRSDWRAGQQIALSDIEEGRDNNGLFELRFDDDRYLPFEGTGTQAFGGGGLVVYLVLDEQRVVYIVRIDWLG